MAEVPEGLRHDVSLAVLTSLGVGGPAAHFLDAASPDALLRALSWADGEQLPVFLLGGGSNVLIADSGWSGLVLRYRHSDCQWDSDGDGVVARVAAGVEWDVFVQETIRRGLSGLECTSGIPGWVGGAPIQNVGAYGQEVAETIVGVEVLDRSSGERSVLGPAECGFAYRDSSFKSGRPGRHLILGVHFRLTRGGDPALRYPELQRRAEETIDGPPTLGDVRRLVLGLRRAKSMLLDPTDPDAASAGSFFTNPILEPAQLATVEAALEQRGIDPETMPRFAAGEGRTKLAAAWLIERAGFHKGQRMGNAGISSKHSLALINCGGARASDLVALASSVRTGVSEALGVLLQPEPRFVGFDRSVDALLEEGSESH